MALEKVIMLKLCGRIINMQGNQSYYHNAGSRFASLQPSYGISSCEKSGNSTCIPPTEFNVQ